MLMILAIPMERKESVQPYYKTLVFQLYVVKLVIYHVRLIVLDVSHDVEGSQRISGIAFIVLVSFEDLVVLRIVSKTVGDPIFG
jgi:hypothetical protein